MVEVVGLEQRIPQLVVDLNIMYQSDLDVFHFSIVSNLDLKPWGLHQLHRT